MTKTYQGSCHCGTVRYEADIDFTQGTGRCNCTYCLKTRSWGVIIRPQAFRLAPGVKEGTAYHQHASAPVKYHCPTCGVHTHGRGNAEYMGGAFVSVFIATLDDAAPDELLSGPLRYSNGRDNDWRNAPKEVRHL